MTWVTVDDGAPSHPKLVRAGAASAWLWLSGLAYSNKHTLNGRLDKDIVPGLYMPLAAKAMKLAEKLVAVGLWHDRGDFFEIHDYGDYQDRALKDAVTARRTYERNRKREQRESRSGTKSGTVPEPVPPNVPDIVPDNDGTKSGTVPEPVPSAPRAGVPAGARAASPLRSEPLRSEPPDPEGVVPKPERAERPGLVVVDPPMSGTGFHAICSEAWRTAYSDAKAGTAPRPNGTALNNAIANAREIAATRGLDLYAVAYAIAKSTTALPQMQRVHGLAQIDPYAGAIAAPEEKYVDKGW